MSRFKLLFLREIYSIEYIPCINHPQEHAVGSCYQCLSSVCRKCIEPWKPEPGLSLWHCRNNHPKKINNYFVQSNYLFKVF